MANRSAEVTFPDGRVATIEGDEANIRDFISSLPDSNNAKIDKSQYILGNPEYGLIASPERMKGGNREVLRTLGGEDPAEAYNRGFNTPSETFQNQLLRTGIIPQSNGTTSVLNSFIGGSVGTVTDTVTSPWESILLGANNINLKDVPKSFKAMVGKGGIVDSSVKTVKRGTKALGDFITKPSALERLMADKQALETTYKATLDTLESQKKDIIAGTKDFIGGNKNSVGQDIPGVIPAVQQADEAALIAKYVKNTGDLKTEIKVFSESSNPGTDSIPNVAQKATLEARAKVPVLQNKINTGFGKDIEAAYGNETINPEDIGTKLGEVLKRARIIASDSDGFVIPAKETLSSSEKAVKSYYESLIQMEKGQPLKISSVDQDLRRIFNVKSGKTYGSGEHILTDVRQALMEDGQIWGKNKDINIVRAKWRPKLQAKTKSYQIFDPYNRAGANETTKGVSFFSRYAEQAANPHAGTLGPDEITFIQNMQEEFGKDVFGIVEQAGAKKASMIKNLQNLPQQQQAELAGIRSAHAEKATEIVQNAEKGISELDSVMAKTSAEHTTKSSLLDELIKKAERSRKIKKNIALVAGGAGAEAVRRRVMGN